MGSTRQRIDYLWRLAHTYAASNPQLARCYLTQLQSLAVSNDVDIAGTASIRFCSYCAGFFIPSQNCKVRVRSIDDCGRATKCKIDRLHKTDKAAAATPVTPIRNKTPEVEEADVGTKKRKRSACKNVLAYHCNACEHVTYFEGTPSSYLERRIKEYKGAASAKASVVTSRSTGPKPESSTPTSTPRGKTAQTPSSQTKGAKNDRRRPPSAKKKKTLKSMLAEQNKSATAAPSALNLYAFLESIK